MGFTVFTLISEHSLSSNSSLWELDYEGLLHSKKTFPETSPFRSSSLLSHQARSWLSQNMGQKPQEKQLSCDMLLKLSRYILMDTFGPSLAWNLFRFYNCDREINLPKIHISPLKVAQHKVKPFLLHRLLQLLRDMGVLSEAQQSKANSLLKKQMLKPRKTPLEPKGEQSGRYIRKRYSFGISNAFWCWLSDFGGCSLCCWVRGGHHWVQSGTWWSCAMPGAGVQCSGWAGASLECSGLSRRSVTRQVGSGLCLQQMLDKGWYSVQRAVIADSLWDSLWELIQVLKAALW